MDKYNREQLKYQLDREEALMNNIISITPIILVFLMFLLRQIVYDISFCMQDPLPEYPELFHIRRFVAFTRQTLLEILYMWALFGLLVPNSKNRGNGTPCNVRDYGGSAKKTIYWVLLIASAMAICLVPVLKISELKPAWIYRLGFLFGEAILTIASYVIIRIAFRNKVNQTIVSTHRNHTGLLTLVAVLTVALTVLIHNIIVP